MMNKGLIPRAMKGPMKGQPEKRKKMKSRRSLLTVKLKEKKAAREAKEARKERGNMQER